MTMGGRAAIGDKIQWNRLEQTWFDRIVETLLMHKFRGIAKVAPVDGRGGDGGVDVAVTCPDGLLTIYQLKYFPEGMSGGFVKRREQVKRSYVQGVTHHEPDEWILVLPRNYTNSERRYVQRLSAATPDGKRSPNIEMMGQSDLDQMLIDFPAVDRWLALDHVRHTREIFEREQAAFLQSPAADLANRVGDLGALVDSSDPDWTWDFARHGNITTQTLRAQHDNAAEVSPIQITLGMNLDLSSSLGDSIRRSIQFGSPERVVIPGSALTRFEVTGPHIVQGMTSPDRLVITSLPLDTSPAVGMLAEIRFPEGEQPAATQEGTVKAVRQGSHGFTAELAFFGGKLAITAELPVQAAEVATMTIVYDLHGLSPASVGSVLETVLRLRTDDGLEIYVDGQRVVAAKRSSEVDCEDADFKEQVALYKFSEDLAAVLAHTKQNMTFPNEIAPEDRVNARVARLLLDGYIVASPLARGIHAQISSTATLTPEFREVLLTRVNTRWPVGSYSVPITGRHFDIGRAVAIHPESWVKNGAAVVAAFDRGTADGLEMVVKPGDDPYFFVYLPSAIPSDRAEQWYARWGLDDISEPWLERPWLTPSE